MDDVERRFEAAMVSVYERARSEAGYNATMYLRMLSDHGGLETARRLIAAPRVSDGFATLWEKKRLDLTVEAVVLQDEFASLFTEDERERALRRLEEFGYRFPTT